MLRSTKTSLSSILLLSLGLATPLAADQARPLETALRLDHELSVEPVRGQLGLTVTDLALPSGHPDLQLRRRWSGDRWDFAIEARIEAPRDGRAVYMDGEGRVIELEADGAGGYRGLEARGLRLTASAEGYELGGFADGRRERFARDGRLLQRSRPDLSPVFYAWQGGRVLSVESARNRITLSRDAAGRIVTASDGCGESLRFHRDAEGRIVERRSTTRGRCLYSYNAEGQLASAGSGALEISYDDDGRVTRIGGREYASEAYRYFEREDPLRALLTEVEIGGAEPVLVACSADGRLLEALAADGARLSVARDALGRVTEVIDPDGRVTRLGYDARGRRARLELPGGERIELRYLGDAASPCELRHADGRVWQLSYDDAGRVLSCTAPTGEQNQYSYDSEGRLARWIDPAGLEERYRYDSLGRLVAKTDTRGRRWRLSYDGEDRLESIDVTGEPRARLSYDAAGRVRAIYSGERRTGGWEYDQRGRLIAETDASGHRVERRLDARGRTMELRDEAGLLERFERDAAGRVEAITDALGNTTRFRYEGARETVTLAGGGQVVLERDGRGRVTRQTLPGGETLSYRYDEAGRLQQVNAGGRALARFGYDRRGALRTMSDDDSSYLIERDAFGRVTALTDGALKKTIRYRYDRQGRRVAMTLPHGTVRYERDAHGDLSALTDTDGGRVVFTRDAAGRLTEARYPSGVVSRRSYDAAGQLSAIETRDAEGAVLSARQYEYDARGRRVAATDERGVTERYSYDARGRLSELRRGERARSYAYDAADNLTALGVSGARRAAKIGAGNRLERTARELLKYDAAGRIIARVGGRGTTRYAYDLQSQLTHVERPDGRVVRYGYAPNGARVWREDRGVKRFYLLDFADVVAEYDKAGRLLASYTHGDGIDELIASHSARGVRYAHQDAIGSVIALSDGAGARTARYRYAPFGALSAAEGPDRARNPYRFAGRRVDDATGLAYLRARSYSPRLRRFLTPDPTGFADSLNRYSYVGNDPIQRTDPYGLFWSLVRQSFGKSVAYSRGFVKGGARALKDTAVGLVKLPVYAVKGVYYAGQGTAYAVQNPAQAARNVAAASRDAYFATGRGIYKTAVVVSDRETYRKLGRMARDDPERFGEGLGYGAVTAATAVAGPGALGKVGQAAGLASRGGRLAQVASGLGKGGGALARTSRAAGQAAGRVGSGARAAAGKVGSGARAAAGKVGSGARAAAGKVGSGARAVGRGARKVTAPTAAALGRLRAAPAATVRGLTETSAARGTQLAASRAKDGSRLAQSGGRRSVGAAGAPAAGRSGGSAARGSSSASTSSRGMRGALEGEAPRAGGAGGRAGKTAPRSSAYTDTLNPAQAKNLKRFKKKLPAGAEPTIVRELPNGGRVFQSNVPGRVPGSRAVYEKQVDAAGKTLEFIKTTYDPAGKIVHVKDKIRGTVLTP